MWSLLNDELTSGILIKLINHMSIRVNKHELVFDLCDLTTLVVGKFKDNPSISSQYFLTLFTRHYESKANPQIKEMFNELMDSLLDLEENKSDQFVSLIGIQMILTNRVNDKQFKYLKQLGEEKSVLLELFRVQKSNLKKEILQCIVALYMNELKEFISNGSNLNEIYSLILLLENHQFAEKLKVDLPTGFIERINKQ